LTEGMSPILQCVYVILVFFPPVTPFFLSSTSFVLPPTFSFVSEIITPLLKGRNSLFFPACRTRPPPPNPVPLSPLVVARNVQVQQDKPGFWTIGVFFGSPGSESVRPSAPPFCTRKSVQGEGRVFVFVSSFPRAFFVCFSRVLHSIPFVQVCHQRPPSLLFSLVFLSSPTGFPHLLFQGNLFAVETSFFHLFSCDPRAHLPFFFPPEPEFLRVLLPPFPPISASFPGKRAFALGGV